MHGAAVGEDAGELVVGHARPVTDAAGIEVHERRAGGRIEADATALQAEPGKADLLQRHARNEEIHGMAQHVLAEARDAGMGGAAAEHGVGGGGAIGGDDLDRLLGIDVAIDFPQNIEQVAVHRGLVLRTPVPQEVIELLQRGLVVAAVTLEGDCEVFAGMGVVERQRAGFAKRGSIVNRSCAGKQQQ